MGLYIKNEKMPRGCIECFVRHDFVWLPYCYLLGKYVSTDKLERNKNCPLIEIQQPHGRLIDSGMLCSSLLAGWRTAEDEADKVICEVMSDIVTPIVVGTPTVIPAENDETCRNVRLILMHAQRLSVSRDVTYVGTTG